MEIRPGKKTLALIDISRSEEFTGDDVDQFSKVFDLGGMFSKIQVFLPALTSGVVSPFIQWSKELDEVPLQDQTLDKNATGHFANASTTTEGSIVMTFDVGAMQYGRIKVAGNQAADRNIYVRGC